MVTIITDQMPMASALNVFVKIGIMINPRRLTIAVVIPTSPTRYAKSPFFFKVSIP